MVGLAIAGITVLILGLDLLGVFAEIHGLVGRQVFTRKRRRARQSKAAPEYFRRPDI